MKRPSQKIILLAITVGITTVIVGAFYFIRPHQKLDRVVIADARHAAFGLLYTAKAKGYFRDEGLHVELLHFPSGRDALEGIISGKAELATAYETAVVLRALQGLEVAAITSLHEARRNMALIARKDHGITRIEHLRGKKVGITPHTSNQFFLISLLRSFGVNPKEIEVVNVGPQLLGAEFKTDRVDAVIVRNPELFRIQRAFRPEQISTFYSDIYIETSMLVGFRSQIARRKGVYSRLLRALYRAEQLEYADPNEVQRSVVQELGPNSSESAEEIASYWNNLKRAVKLTNVNLEIMQQQVEMFETMDPGRSHPLNVSNVLYPQLLDLVSPEAVTLAGFPVESSLEGETRGRHNAGTVND